MPVVVNPQQMPVRRGPGWVETEVASPGVFGSPVRMAARQVAIEPGSDYPVTAGDDECLVYVVSGEGTAEVDGSPRPVSPESVLWLEPGDSTTLHAGAGGLTLLAGVAPGDGSGAATKP